jgi:hypothetical protein
MIDEAAMADKISFVLLLGHPLCVIEHRDQYSAQYTSPSPLDKSLSTPQEHTTVPFLCFLFLPGDD